MTVRPAFFERTAAGFRPTGVGMSSWDPEVLGGVAVGSLLAVVLDEATAGTDLHVARLTVDILGVVPRQLLQSRVVTIRKGRQQEILAAELFIGDRVLARATALRLRSAETPQITEANPYAPPEAAGGPMGLPADFCANAIRTRTLFGAISEAGPGAMWAAFDLEVVAGLPMSPLARAVLIADFGNGVGNALPRQPWTLANVDICVNFLRMPRGEWVLIHATTESAGNGHAIVHNVFADREGVYARGAQTLFVAPGEPADWS